MQRFFAVCTFVLFSLLMLNTAAHAQYEGSGFSGKGIIVWGNDAFNQAANPPATNNWWKEFKDFILDSEAGLGGTIYKDCIRTERTDLAPGILGEDGDTRPSSGRSRWC